MNALKKLACAAAVALSMGSAHAGAIMNDWVFNPEGTGFTAGQQVSEYLNITGNGFIQITGSGGPSFSFVEHAVFKVRDPDNTGRDLVDGHGGGNVTAIFEANGTGQFSGDFQFSGGKIRMYRSADTTYGSTQGFYGANSGTQIAEFDVLAGGGGKVDGSGNPVGNGMVSVFAQASTPGGMNPGYFFRSNGNDLSGENVLAFAFTGANGVSQATDPLVNELICEFAGFTGAGCTKASYANSPGNYILVANNGTFKLAEVPEPGSLALFGIAMLGAGVVSRKRAKKA